ncbi:MAG: 2-C-methyl-D-erythritol 2,4-cyclodiphosphate synthase [Clostridia bacterium]|nr:2-C-methyl-D-erythritol 2,4-cyclodiphosphate synthase [Clostridia bacterium]
MRDCWAVVVAAGRGLRMGLPYNKAFYVFRGRSVLNRSLDAMTGSGCFDGIVVVLAEGDLDAWRQLCAREGENPLVREIAIGGATRQESVRNGLEKVPESVGIVAVHDAARAFVTRDVIVKTVESARQYGSGVIAEKLVDTVKVIDADGYAIRTPERARLRTVQTPQAFLRENLAKAHELARLDGFAATDDAALVEKYIGPVRLVESEDSARNVKLTRAEDVRRMTMEFSRETRAGHGYDAHRLTEGRALILLGVRIPFEKGLLGHSDADVAAHAAMDALLGAAGLPDIGRQFPDSDPAYAGADSMRLVGQVADLLEANGHRILNIDVTIIAQAPKLMPHIPAMRENLARALGIQENRVNVKATTTEGMGFEGRGEGISAHAVAMIEAGGYR